eukprot:917461-Pelagomonas_calceolata.AAC.5
MHAGILFCVHANDVSRAGVGLHLCQQSVAFCTHCQFIAVAPPSLEQWQECALPRHICQQSIEFSYTLPIHLSSGSP